MSEAERLLRDLYSDRAGHRLRDHARRTNGSTATEPPSTILCCYPDHITGPTSRSPLAALGELLDERFTAAFETLHILPFYPASGDGGYAVTDHGTIDVRHGRVEDFRALSRRFSIMADLVLNHVSPEHRWFRDALAGDAEHRAMFIEQDPAFDTSRVARPRATPLFTTYSGAAGNSRFWTTYGPGQVDLNYSNPVVLEEMLRLCEVLAALGVSRLRLDAAAFLWKVSGTSCANLPGSAAICRLIELLGANPSGITVASETDASYEGGQSSEPVLTYRHDLAPALAHAIITSRPDEMVSWLRRIEAARTFNWITFLATHDGLYLRPQAPPIADISIRDLERSAEWSTAHVIVRRPAGTYEIAGPLHHLFGRDRERRRARTALGLTVLASLPGVPEVYLNTLFDAPVGIMDTEQGSRSLNRARLSAQRQELAVDKWLQAILRAFAIRRSNEALTAGHVENVSIGGKLLRFDRVRNSSRIHVLVNFSDEEEISPTDLRGEDLLSGQYIKAGTPVASMSVLWIRPW